MEPTQCSETSAFNTKTPGKYPEDNLSLQQHGKSLKNRKSLLQSNPTRILHIVQHSGEGKHSSLIFLTAKEAITILSQISGTSHQ
jgi:hypothetical protein